MLHSFHRFYTWYTQKFFRIIFKFCITRCSSIAQSVYSTFDYSTAHYSVVAGRCVVRCLYSGVSVLLHTEVVVSFFKGTPQFTTLSFTRIAWSYAPYIGVPLSFFSGAYNPMASPFPRLGDRCEKNFLLHDCGFAVAVLLVMNVVYQQFRGLCWAPSNGSHTLDYYSYPCTELSYRSLDRWFPHDPSWAFVCR